MFSRLASNSPPSAAAASAAAAPSQAPDQSSINLRPPTKQQLHDLQAVFLGPTSSFNRGGRAGKGKLKKKINKLARDGQIVSKMFDALGVRPQPNNGLNLEQAIQMELEYTLPLLITSNGTAGITVFNATSFALSTFNAAASLTTVFDQYRFEQIEAWLECTQPNSTQAFPIIYSCVDLDDATAPTQPGQISDHQGALVAQAPGGHYHRWKPHMAVAAYSGAFTSYSNLVAGWIDVASPSVQHYGLKLGVLSNGVSFQFGLTVRAVISFRAPAIG